MSAGSPFILYWTGTVQDQRWRGSCYSGVNPQTQHLEDATDALTKFNDYERVSPA